MKRIRLNEARLQKLYNDVTEEVVKERICSLRGGYSWNGTTNNRDDRLGKLQDAIGEAAIRSILEPIQRRPKGNRK